MEGARAFVNFMRSMSGRLIRVIVGALIEWYALAALSGGTRIVVMVIGLVPIAAGALNFCLLAPLFRGDSTGRPAAPSPR